MLLSALIDSDDPDDRIDIKGLTADSRAVQPGFLFAALPGVRADGEAFIGQALERGAIAVIAGQGAIVPAGNVRLISDYNPRRRFAKLAARFYGRQPDTVVAVTGTNGKTSVANFTRQIWTRLGLKAASLGTLGLSAPGFPQTPSLTTPDPVTLHRMLAELAESGVQHLAMEASSHGLAQYRLDGVRLAAAAFTNITRDHLDYHPSFDDYFYAKLRLFGEVMAPGGIVVYDKSAGISRELEDICWARAHTLLSVGAGGDVNLLSAAPVAGGQRLKVHFQSRDYDIWLPLAGGFQASNALIAATLVIATGAEPAAVFAALERLEPVPGRLQLAGKLRNDATIYVDYAHTPDALDNVLRTMRGMAGGQVWLVFGCGGDRDAGKRPVMGEIAARLADHVIVTDDNPRGEDPASIRAAVLAGCPGAREIGDRAAAIRAAIAGLRPGDVLLVAGKGHEQGQIVGAELRPFDDAEEVRKAIAELPS